MRERRNGDVTARVWPQHALSQRRRITRRQHSQAESKAERRPSPLRSRSRTTARTAQARPVRPASPCSGRHRSDSRAKEFCVRPRLSFIVGFRNSRTAFLKDALGEGPPALQIGTEDLRAVALCHGGSPASLRRHHALLATRAADFAPPAMSSAHYRPCIGRRLRDFMPAAAHHRLSSRCVAATAESRVACLSVAGGYMSEHTFVAARSRLPGMSSIDNVTAIDCMAVPRRSRTFLAYTELRNGLR